MAFFSFFLALSEVWSYELGFQIAPKEMQCFFEDLEASKTFFMQFGVVRGGLLDIKLRVKDPNENVITDRLAFFNKKTEQENEQEGRLEFVASTTGRHEICFDNTMSRWTSKVVSFYVDTTQHRSEEVAKLEHLGPVVDSVIKIADELDNIEKLQHYMRVREQSHRDASESTNARVQWLALLEWVLLIGMSFFQLRYIRNWFSETAPGHV